MKRFAWGPPALLVMMASGCSLHQVKYRTLPSEPPTTIHVQRLQALDWSVVNSYYLWSEVTLSYPLCRGQHLIGKPAVDATAQTVSITLWANPKTCANPAMHPIVVQLGQNLGHRPLSNPDL